MLKEHYYEGINEQRLCENPVFEKVKRREVQGLQKRRGQRDKRTGQC